MKKLFKVAVIAVCALTIGNFAQAQSKIGYVNFTELVQSMPEFKTVKTQLDAYQKQFIDQLSTMNTAYQAELKKDQDAEKTMTDAQKTAAAGQLQDMQKRMQDYQTSAQQQVEQKSNELFKPLSDKAKSAVSDVAKEKGYTYVLDSSQGAALIVSPESDDLMASAKVKLGVK